MGKERFEVFGNVIKDNEDIPSLLNNYQATVRLNELNDRIKELEKDLEFTTKTANELIEIKHKLEQELNSKNMLCENYNCGLNKKIQQLEQELAELKEKAIVPKFKIGQEIWCIQYMTIFKFKINKVEIHRGEEEAENRIIYGNWEDMIYQIEENCFATEQEALNKLKEIQGNE